MKPERWGQVKKILDEALSLESAQREAFLDRACAGDRELRSEVESLLASHEQAGTGFLKSPAVDLKSGVAPLPTASIPGRRIGVYQVIEEIGHGGMGEVYRAARADGQYTKEVAIKLVRGSLDSRFVTERFLNERQILASLDHPNIARLLDGGTTDDGIPYLVMELIDGKPIDQYCDERKLSVTERLRLFRQVCVAVHYAHQRLVIHRDIKPSNVMVTREGEPKLLDFGIAKIVSPIHDAQTTLMQAMTPEYASPEQIRGEPITTATDVYSLGVVLYQLLTGRSPYPGDTRTPHKLAQAVCETEPGRPSAVVVRRDAEEGQERDPEQFSSTREGTPAKLQRRLGGDLDDITMMALRKEPARRYSSVEQFAEDIRRHLEGVPVVASKGSWRYRAGKFVQRNKVGIAAATIVVLAVVGGVGATIREAGIARANGRRAEARFNDVRALANSLIFELDDAIANLPGSTPARKLLVDKAVLYLDALAKEAKGDPGLQRELASAYQKLARVQNSPGRSASLGDSGAALESYRKALTIREALVAANPKSQDDQLALAVSYSSIGGFAMITSGDLREGLNNAMKAQAILESLANSTSTTPEILNELEGNYELIGNLQGGSGSSANMGDVDAALGSFRKALAIAERILKDKPDDIGARDNVAILNEHIGEDLVKKGDRSAALQYYSKALDTLNALMTGPADTRLLRQLSIVYQRIGNAQMMSGDSKSALKNYRATVDISEKMAAADPQNALARADVANHYAFAGNAAVHAGNEVEGMALLRKAIDIQEREAARDPRQSFLRRVMGLTYQLRGQIQFKSRRLDAAMADFKRAAALTEGASGEDIGARLVLAATDSKIADVLAAQGGDSDAQEMYQKVLAMVEPIAHSAHPSVEAQYTVADTYSGLGTVLVKRGSKKGIPVPQQVDLLRQARSWFEQSLAEWQRVPNPGKFSPTGFETGGPARVAQELASCEAQLRNQRNSANTPRSGDEASKRQ